MLHAEESSDSPLNDRLRVEVSSDSDECRIILSGEFDLAAVEQAEHALRRAENDGHAVVVDFSDLAFMDLTGLHVLMAAHERLGPRLALRGCSPQVHRLLELTGTADRLPLVD